ncbi:MAG: HAMP domain-containing sensor histidine kinase [Pseudomonadota bacterium]
MTFFGVLPPEVVGLSFGIGWAATALCVVVVIFLLVWRDFKEVETEDESVQEAPAPSLFRDLDVAGLSHDLKSPLTSILGFSQMMKDRELGPDASNYDAYPDYIFQSARTLEDRVKTLLDLIAAERGGLAVRSERVDLIDVCEAFVAQFLPQARSAGVTLSLSKKQRVYARADRALFERILENLISNALKYSDRGSRVLIRVMAGSDYAILIVSDSGTGIGAADLSALAQPFSQGAHTGEREGTGLGLALVKRLVELHQGEFRIRSAEGRGTEMIVKLPLAEQA